MMDFQPGFDLCPGQGGAHRRMLDAIMRRDKEAARLWARRHINDWRKGFERAGNDLDQPIDRLYLQSLVKDPAPAG